MGTTAGSLHRQGRAASEGRRKRRDCRVHGQARGKAVYELCLPSAGMRGAKYPLFAGKHLGPRPGCVVGGADGPGMVVFML